VTREHVAATPVQQCCQILASLQHSRTGRSMLHKATPFHIPHPILISMRFTRLPP
jgi:hypothetical protein